MLLGGNCETGPNGTSIDLIADLRSIDTGNRALGRRVRSLDAFRDSATPYAGRLVPVELDATVKQTPGGLELDAAWKVDERLLRGCGLPLSATAHVTAALVEAQ